MLNEVLVSIWENDGNAQQSDWFEARDHCAELADEEKQILERLGVSWLVCGVNYYAVSSE